MKSKISVKIIAALLSTFVLMSCGQSSAPVNNESTASEVQPTEETQETSTESETEQIPAPITVQGRYEDNRVMMLPGFTYSMAESHEVDGRQGIACGDGVYYVSGSTSLSAYDADWNLIKSADSPFEGFTDEVNHIGDIDVYNDEIFAGIEYFMDGEASNIQIAVYDAKTLKLVRSIPFANESMQSEVSGIAVDPDNKSIWLCSWADGESGRYLYRYDLTTGEYLGKVHLQAPPQWIQGIAYYDGWIYMSADDGTADLGEPDHVYRCRVDISATSSAMTLEKTLDDVDLQGEIEGISFDKNRKQMLVSYNRGAQIVLGMPQGFYEGYDHEIHEVYVYDMARNNPALDYSLDDNWISKPDSPAMDADIFFILPTVNMKSTTADNEDIYNLRTASRFVKTFAMEKGIVQEAGDIFAPYYRQTTIGSHLTEDGMVRDNWYEEDERSYYDDIAYADIRNAFQYYMEKCSNGRPFVLFGFSQGGEEVVRLLEEFGQEEDFSNRLIAAYAIGFPITGKTLSDYPWLKMAQGETDTGSIISFTAMDARADLPDEKEYSINPLNWKTDNTPAAKTENAGCVITDTAGEITEETPEYCGAYLDEKSGRLIVTDIENQDELYQGDNGVFPSGDYHLYDLNFFYRNLQQNIRVRIDSFKDKAG
ncbi:MAG: DUF3089 domain-containing protein [Lachnospiraceae bacterium]|nr:DUF3089 domain-containing protein [Lachnospiraceae bacterium]